MINLLEKYQKDHSTPSEVERFYVQQKGKQGFVINLTVKLAGGRIGYELIQTILVTVISSLVMGTVIVLFLNRDQRPIPPIRRNLPARATGVL